MQLVNHRDSAVTTFSSPPGGCTNLTLDTDGDGLTDCEEICIGTDPFDPDSYLWIRIDRTGTLDVQRLTFPTSTGLTYWIESNPNLYSNGWTIVISNLPGIGTNRSVMHTSPVERIYYRVGVEQP